MTRYEKIAISLPAHTAERVRRAVKNGDAPSASAYITQAIERKMTREESIALLDEWLMESGGPMTEEEARMVDGELYRPRSYGPGVKPAAGKTPSRRRFRNSSTTKESRSSHSMKTQRSRPACCAAFARRAISSMHLSSCVPADEGSLCSRRIPTTSRVSIRTSI